MKKAKNILSSVGIQTAMNPDAVLLFAFSMFAMLTGSFLMALGLLCVAIVSVAMTQAYVKEMVDTELNWGKRNLNNPYFEPKRNIKK